MKNNIENYFTLDELYTIKKLLGLVSTDSIVLNSVHAPSPVADLWVKGILIRNEGRTDNKIELCLHPHWDKTFRDMFNLNRERS